MRKHALYLAGIVFILAACNEPQQASGPAAAVAESPAALKPGCYLGHLADSSDTLQLRILRSDPAAFSGAFRIAIREKDQRSGTLEAARGADGIYRGIFRFMQEGMRDSVPVQFQALSEAALGMRPAAYDPGSGREYPDSTKPFSIRLDPGPCADGTSGAEAAH